MALLNSVAREIATELDLDRLLERAVRLVQDHFGYPHVAIFAVDREQGEVVMRSRAGDFAHLYPAKHQLPIDQGIVGWVARRSETLLANDVRAEPRYVNLYPDLVPTLAELAIPIRLHGQIVGVLDLLSPEANAFDESDVAVMETLADQIAVAMHNARLFEETAQLKVFHESIVQSVGEGIVVEDEAGAITFANPAAVRMLGCRSETLVGKHWMDLVPPEQHAIVQAANERRARGRIDRYELDLLRMDGTLLPVVISGAPWLDPDTGRIAGRLDRPLMKHAGTDVYIAFLPKPFTLEALTQKVREVLDKSASMMD